MKINDFTGFFCRDRHDIISFDRVPGTIVARYSDGWTLTVEYSTRDGISRIRNTRTGTAWEADDSICTVPVPVTDSETFA